MKNPEYFTLKNNKTYKIVPEDFLKLTAREVINGPYVIKAQDTRLVGNDEAFQACKKGTVLWLHEFIENLRVSLGMGPEILDKSLGMIGSIALTKSVFPGAQVLK